MGWPDIADVALEAAVETFDHGDVTYTRPGGTSSFAVRGVYDAEHAAVDISSGVPVDVSVPAIGVRLADFLEVVGAHPEPEGQVTVGALRFLVRSVQPDGEGGARLELEQLA